MATNKPIIFFGTDEYAVGPLKAVAEKVSLVVTQPDRPSGRGLKYHPSPVKLAAQELGIQVVTPEKCRDPEFIKLIKSFSPKALFTASYGQIMPEALLDSAEYGGFNFHVSILPKYRGASPAQRALLNGDTVTGVTLMQMAKGMDTGDIIDICKIDIEPDEVYTELLSRLSVVAAHMAHQWADRLICGDYPRTPQNSDEATLAPKVNKEECELSVLRSARDEYNRYRGFSARPGTFLRSKYGEFKVLKARCNLASGKPGELLDIKNALTIAFQSGSLDILELKPAGKQAMLFKDFVNGHRLKSGDFMI